MPEANANPEKRFFIQLITRDIALDDAILDLIDNSVDSLVRSKDIDIYRDFIKDEHEQGDVLAEIRINCTSKTFKIEDNCGGITFENAERDVFRFGRPDPNKRMSLSVFGIGMKRAIFKIGRKIEMESHAIDSGFHMNLDVCEWMDMHTEDWRIPIERLEGAADETKAGTKIVISRLNEEISDVIKAPTFANQLFRKIQAAYPFYIGKYLNIFINEKRIPEKDLIFSQSSDHQPNIETWEDGNVKITLMCGFLPRGDDIQTQWTTEKSGWYLVCNGRVVVHANKTSLTGWGLKRILPQFMPKNRGFLGIVFFSSSNPEELPWNTTKRGINSESGVFLRTRMRMITASRPVLQFQDKMYRSKDTDDVREEYRDSVKKMDTVSATKQAAERASAKDPIPSQRYLFPQPSAHPKMSTIKYEVKEEDINRVKKGLGRSSMYNYEVGQKTFKYYMDRECS